MKIFDIDSPLMQGLGKMADLMILNLIALVCCIPIFTIGASITALYYMALKIVRNEEVYIVKGFLKSFKQNFKQATIIWLIQIVVMVILGLDYYIMYGDAGNTPNTVVQVVWLAGAVIAIVTFVFIYPVLSKFDNNLRNTFKNTMLMAVMQMPKIVLMVIMWAIPVLIGIFVFQLFPLVFLFGMSLPAVGSAFLYNKFFKKMEDKMIERAIEAGEVVERPGEEDEHIFSDVLDPALDDSKKNSQ